MNENQSLVNVTVNFYVDGKLANQPAVPTEEKPAEEKPGETKPGDGQVLDKNGKLVPMPKDSSITES
jgi:hypothetical protein